MKTNIYKISLLVFLTAILLLIACYPYWAISHICPIFDGNNCVSRASNAGLFLLQGNFSAFWLKLQADWNNFFSVIYFSIFSAVLGPGRIAWGWAWSVACLGLIAFQIFVFRKEMKAWQIMFIFLLSLSCSSALNPIGGFLDQRFDLFSLLLVVAAISSICANRLTLALYLSIAAIYAKGPALPIFTVLWLSAYFTRVISSKEVVHAIKQNKIALAGIVILLAIYKIWFLQTVLSYNLIAVKTAEPSLKNVILQYIFSSGRNVVISHWYYFKSLFNRALLFYALLGLAIAVLFFKKNNPNKKFIMWGVTVLGLTYILFSSHPVHSPVLDLWFWPGIWILSFAIEKELRGCLILCNGILIVLAIKLSFTIYMLFSAGVYLQPSYQEKYQHMREQATSLGAELQQDPKISSQVVRLLPNFISTPEPGILFAYDTYRVLLFEALGKNSPIIEGWELATYSDNWQQEIATTDKNELFLAMIVTHGEDKIHFRNKANKIAKEYLATVNKKCELRNIKGAIVPGYGTFRFYFTSTDLSHCALVSS